MGAAAAAAGDCCWRHFDQLFCLLLWNNVATVIMIVIVAFRASSEGQQIFQIARRAFLQICAAAFFTWDCGQ
jgi:hypothetical protein